MRYALALLVLVGCGTATGGPAGDASTETGADAGADAGGDAGPDPAERVIAWGHPQTCTSSGDCRPNDPVEGVAGAGANCGAGVCRWLCGAARANCDGNATNGCEADVSTDANCGACGNACGAGTHCTRVCSGSCGYLCR